MIKKINKKFIPIYGIAYKCPNIERNENCPLNKIDHLSFSEKIEWIQALDQDTLEEILVCDINCSLNRG